MKCYSMIKSACPALMVACACLLPLPAYGQASGAISLEPPAGLDLQSHTYDSKGNPLPAAPDNFRRLGEARVGELADLHTVTLRFHQTTRVTAISVTRDFTIEQGGSCVEGNVYAKDSTCRLLIRFTPQGPGTRLGKLTVSHSGSAAPDAFGLGGTSYMPVVSFIPSTITTVPGTYPSSKGLLSGAQNLAVDGGDDLYIADTGNNAVRWMDSSGKITIISDNLKTSAPYGIAVDSFGDAWFSEPAKNALFEILANGPTNQANGSGTDTCTASSPCQLGKEALNDPGSIGIDESKDLMMFENNADYYHGVGISYVQPYPPTFIHGSDQYTYVTPPMAAFAIDPGDNLYTSLATNNTCQILMENFSNAEAIGNIVYHKIVGGHACGFYGDGGQAAGAEISSTIGQIAFDAAGNMYFTDSGNQRVRRIDASTGIVRTIAGNGNSGYAGDGNEATSAELAVPTGLAVDSQGQVYIISGAAPTGSAQVVRKLGVTGKRVFANQLRYTSSPTKTVIVTNTGNDPLTITSTAFTGANPSDFSIDWTSTSCFPNSSMGYSGPTYPPLGAGDTCLIGFVFTPSAGGTRTANFVFLDNTVTNSNVIVLNGTGTLPAPTLKITTPTNGAIVGTSFTLSASVTSSSTPAPTGTVQFLVDGINHGSPVTLSSGAASTSVSGLTNASHTLGAEYSGDSNYAPAGPVTISVTVNSVAAPPIVIRNSLP